MNETLREHVRRYVSPPVIYHALLNDALAAWGQGITLEEPDEN